MTRRGRMMVVMLDDGSAQLEISVFNELFDRHRDKLKEDALLVVQGKAQKRRILRRPARHRGGAVRPRVAARDASPARLKIAMNGRPTSATRSGCSRSLAPYRANGNGSCQVFVRYQNGGAECEIALGDAWRVRPDERLLGELSAWLAPENVQVSYA